jgi:hypothetical protein
MTEEAGQTLSRAKAREIIEGILDDHGYLSPEVLDMIDEQTREKVIVAMFKKDQKIGRSLIT